MPIIDSLLGDIIDVPMEGPTGRDCGMQAVCRWAYIPIEEENVSSFLTAKSRTFENTVLQPVGMGRMKSSSLRRSLMVNR